ncbi:hypothetical protein A3B51_02930 [Candidatus Curtissbacteria bacterium RIFCSPLOWO2_01_FULL_41_18]|uniref:Uncharacterized protein n=2 Tax=Candidatus Curtissiibacteriota TaxID=1752717 RepID=A0A1F5FY95_9BACT|nr:MAG: hypothetical protein A2696_01445 [Candidatus Curtissbacteria bacterium RIFCSPHIGHO2_01_FULL_41_13]OGE05520.1 MAG: hypothetical protein A3B51_02930 [Candidatus Curtissbacteria bacterium RIFCSPLOWO2_01_FULL_41_18]
MVAETTPVSKPESFIDPIKQYSEHDTKMLAMTYQRHLRAAEKIDLRNLYADEGRLIGAMEIEGVILALLGQHDSIQGLTEKPWEIEIEHVRPINERQVMMLGQLYRTARMLVAQREIRLRTWTSGGVSGEDARIDENARELSMTLLRLGQLRLRDSIDQEINF